MPIRTIDFLERTCDAFCAKGQRFAFVKHSGIGVTKIEPYGYSYDRMNDGGSMTPLSREEAAAELIVNQGA